MSDTVITGLMKRREEINDQMQGLQDSLTHLDATIKLFRGDYKPPAAKRGDITRAMLDVLREATQPLVTAEIAEKIGSTAKRTGIALCGQRKKGVVSSQKVGNCAAWEIVK